MANINEATIDSLVELSRIRCSPEERKRLTHDLQKILAYIDQLNELDTDGVEPCCHVLEGTTNVFRPDLVGKILSRKTFLDNSPQHTGGLVRVPTVIKT